MAESSILSRFTVVLWRPKSPGNVGSVARAMKNMGFSRLRIADPMSYRDPSFFPTESERMAWDAADVLKAREEHPTVEAALADASVVAGTISEPPDGHRVLPPRALAERLVEEAGQGAQVAILFGQEDIGLTRDHLSRCHLIGTIPASGAYPSLNLAQAALIFLYEIRLAALAKAARAGGIPDEARSSAAFPEPHAAEWLPAGSIVPAQPAAAARRDSDESIESRRTQQTGHPSRRGAGRGLADDSPPTQDDLEGFYGRLTRALDDIGYFEGSGRPHMVRELRRVFNRALLTRREVAILEGIVHRISWTRSRAKEEP